MKILAAIIPLMLVGARAGDPGDPSFPSYNKFSEYFSYPDDPAVTTYPDDHVVPTYPDDYVVSTYNDDHVVPTYPDDPVVPTYTDTCNYTEGAMCGDQCIRGSYCVCGFDKFYLRSFTGEK